MGSPRTWASSVARCASGWPGALPGVRPAPMAVRLSAGCVHAGPTTPGRAGRRRRLPQSRSRAWRLPTLSLTLRPSSSARGAGGIPSAGGQVFRGRDDLVSRFRFVEDHGTPMRSNGCGLVEVARSSYYAWRAGRLARERRSAADAALREPITRTAQDRPGHGLAQDRLPASTRPPRKQAGV